MTFNIFLLVLVALFPLGELIRIPVFSSTFLKINDLLVLLAVIPFVISQIKKRTIFTSRLCKLFAAFIVWAFITLLFNLNWLNSNQFVISLLYLLRYAIYGLLTFAVINQTKPHKELLEKLMVFSGFLIVLGGYIQYIYYPNLRNLFYLGWDEHLYRLFSSFLDPNFAGAFLVLYFLLTVGLFFEAVASKIQKKQIVYGFLSLATLLAIFLTYSRSAFIMLFVGSIVFLILLKKVKVIGFLVVLFLVFSLISSRFFYIENINFFRTASSEARIGTAKDSLLVIKDHPFVGVGFNTYRYVQIRYGFRTGDGAIESHADAGVDNSFLFVLATTGIVGLCIYLVFWYRIVRDSLKIRTKAKKDYHTYMFSCLVLASVAGVFVDALFINSLFYTFIMEWMWLLVGLLYSTENTSR